MTFSFRRWFNRVEADTPPIAPQAKEPAAAEQHFLTGRKFAGGEGVDQNFAQAVHWYIQAAEQNHSLAQLNLAMLYGQGQGVARDEAKSLLWLTRSARLGNAAAQFRLGVQQHFTSRNSTKVATVETRIEALKWVRLSATQGQHGADNACEFVALGMTREEVAEAERRAAAFILTRESVHQRVSLPEEP